MTFIRVANVGTLQSAVTDWTMDVTINGAVQDGDLHNAESFALSKSAGGPAIEIYEKDALYNKEDPIPVGGLIRGYLVSIIKGDPDYFRQNRDSVVIKVTGRDVFGRSYEGMYRTGAAIGGLPYIRGARLIEPTTEPQLPQGTATETPPRTHPG